MTKAEREDEEDESDQGGPPEVSGDFGNGEELRIEEAWSEARRRAGLDPKEIGDAAPNRPGLLSPYLILYAGFFLGPGVAFLASLFVAPRRLTVRRVSVLLGICGAAWCAIQGSTGVFAPGWSHVGLQMLRSGMNFGASALLLLFWRREFPASFLHDRSSIVLSVVTGSVLLVLFVVLPPETLVYFGR